MGGGGLKNFARKEEVRQNGGVAILYSGFSGDSSWCSIGKKTKKICSLVNKNVLENDSIDIAIIVVLIIHALNFFLNVYTKKKHFSK